MKNLPVWGAIIAFVTSVAGYVVLSVMRVDVSNYGSFIALLIAGTGAGSGIAAWRNTQVIKEQTNGPLNATHDRVADIDQRLANKGV